MSEVCGCVDGHGIDCAKLLQYRFPPPPRNRICRYWDNAKRSFHIAFLHVAVFCVAIYCIFPHFNYLKMRAKGVLSRWYFVPEWKVLREDRDGHELGCIEQIYEPVEEHRRAAFNALMESKYGTNARNRSRSPTPSNTPRVSFVNTRDATQESMDEPLITPPVTGPETRAIIGTLAEILDKMNVPKNVEVPGLLSPIQTEEAGPSRIDASPFSQYSIHPDLPEPPGRNSPSAMTGSATNEPPFPSLRPLRKVRPFKTSAHSQGSTIWMTTFSHEDLYDPPAPVLEDEPGVLHIHNNLSDNTLRVWLLGGEKQWAAVELSAKTPHPSYRDRYLAIRLDGTPSWITLNSWYAAKKRVNSR